MKTFLDTTSKSFTFSSCQGCPSRCCDGREGTVFSQIILDDFEVVYKNFPILFTFGELGYLKAVVLFSDGKSFCPYVQNNQCSIYEDRPSICRVYPLSPNVDNQIYIDDSCPAVNSEMGEDIVKDGVVTKNFLYETLVNYQDKYIQTHFELEKINHQENFEVVKSINNISFYKYIGKIDNQYINYHRSSLQKL
ncbi:MAG: YkgJ family cysteine cluster protein [Arcobacteraceae bacterium]